MLRFHDHVSVFWPPNWCFNTLVKLLYHRGHAAVGLFSPPSRHPSFHLTDSNESVNQLLAPREATLSIPLLIMPMFLHRGHTHHHLHLPSLSSRGTFFIRETYDHVTGDATLLVTFKVYIFSRFLFLCWFLGLDILSKCTYSIVVFSPWCTSQLQ